MSAEGRGADLTRDDGGDRRVFLRWAVVGWLVLLPTAHMGSFAVRGAVASWADVLLALVLGAAGFELLVVAMGRLSADGEDGEAGGVWRRQGPRLDGFHGAILLLLLFAAWVGVGSLWSFHPEYARLKAVGLGAFGLGALAIRWSGLDWRRAADAWLLGTALSLVLTYGLALATSGPAADGMLYMGGRVYGLPFPRVSGPFPHPNLFGDYLLVSAVLLWARWPGLSGGLRTAAIAIAGVMGLTMVLSASTAMVALGVLLLAWGVRVLRRSGGPQAWLAMLGGSTVAAVTAAGLLFPLELDLLDLQIRTAGIRPHMWASALRAVAEAPLIGVGASPFLAEVVDPLGPDGLVHLWDAHSTYISVWGQFGLVGVALIVGAGWLLLRALGRSGRGGSSDGGGGPAHGGARVTTALLAVLVAMAVHGFFIAGEDFRHWWVVVGLVGLVVGRRRSPGAHDP